MALALVLVGGSAVWLARAKRETAELADVMMKPLTSQSGWELAPALRADGEAIAFTWSAKLDGQRQIYVKREKDAEPRELTTSAAAGQVGYLVWSPDAKRIAFKRRMVDGGGAIYWIDQSGGEEHKVIDLNSADLSSSIDWSGDGQFLAFSDSAPGHKPSISSSTYITCRPARNGNLLRHLPRCGEIGIRSSRRTAERSHSRE